MRCRDAIRQLDAFRTGELPWQRAEDIAAHLAGCAECAEELRQIRSVAERLRRMRTIQLQNARERREHGACDGFARLETGLGPAWVSFNNRGITMIDLSRCSAGDFMRNHHSRLWRAAVARPVPERYARAVRLAAEGRLRRNAPVDIAGLPPFQRRVLEALRTIPRGEVRPYSWLARETGFPRAVRAVGTTMARNPVPLLLPCHRVVPAEGGIGHYAYGTPVKRELLRKEGAPLEDLEDLSRAGVRYLGSRSTHVFCFPSCRNARRIGSANRVPFASAEEAAASGYRACRHCRPA
jgi:O-6-methylguanine DNA methyltransferase